MVPKQSLLQRQLKRFFGSDFVIPTEWQGFIAAVDGAYADFEVDRELTERSAELSSKELLEANSDLVKSREMFRLMAESTKAVPFILDLTRGCFTYVGAVAIADSGMPESDWKKPGFLDVLLPRISNQEVRQRFDECESGHFEFVSTLSDDVTELRRLGRELAAAQKLQSVGFLAAGVAHEINTRSNSSLIMSSSWAPR